MKLENCAQVETGFIEKSLTIESNDNGTYKITAKEKPTGNKKERIVEMTFTANGIAALLGTWLAATGNSF